MILLLTVAIVGASAYIWCTRGFFSALLHMMCAIAAGAIAFGVWEPVAYQLLKIAPDRGFGSFLTDMAFAIALVVPYAISLGIIRAIVDKILPANAQCDTVADYVGGGVCGLVAGVVTAGIVLIGIGFMRVKPDFGGYAAVNFSGSARGSLEQNDSKFIPWVDRITGNMYAKLSLTTLRTSEPLAKYYPDVVAAAGANRQTFEGKGRTGLKPKAVELVGWYTVGDLAKPQKFDELTIDARQTTPQKLADLTGEPLNAGSLVGYILRFGSQAREGSGSVVVGNGNIRLVCESMYEEDDYIQLHPIAVISRVNDPARIHYARFRFDSDGFFVSSVGGESAAVLGFEFPVPEGYRPLALYTKNLRFDVSPDELPKTEFAFSSPSERDATILAGRLKAMSDVGPILDPNTGKPVQVDATNQPTLNETPYQVRSSLGFIIQKGTEGSLKTTKLDKGGYVIEGGTHKLAKSAVHIERNLQINAFATDETTVMVQADVTPRTRPGEIARLLDSVDRKGRPVLVDSEGVKYEAVGFIYEEQGLKHIRYTREAPLQTFDEAGKPVTVNNPDRTLRLLFLVSRGVTIDEFRIGDTTIDRGLKLSTDSGFR
jgi:hypothetical protein